MQIIRLGCGHLRDGHRVAPWGGAATCQGSPGPGAVQSRLSCRVPLLPGVFELCNIDSSWE